MTSTEPQSDRERKAKPEDSGRPAQAGNKRFSTRRHRARTQPGHPPPSRSHPRARPRSRPHIPISTARDALRRALQSEGFGCLQHSVWISPRPLSKAVLRLCGRGDDVGTVLTMAGRPDGQEKDADITLQAWDFDRINLLYDAHAQVLIRRPKGAVRDQKTAEAFRAWAAEERCAWCDAVGSDPLLPARLLPRGYRGRKAWKQRRQVLAAAAAQISSTASLQRAWAGGYGPAFWVQGPA